ncbi:hypothetical protein WJX77_002392 [Trebouxia sp. C0004]
MTVVTEQQQQDPSGGVQQRQPMQQLAAAALAQVALCRNSGLLTSSCLSTQKRRRVIKCKEESGSNLYVQGFRHTRLVKQTKRGSSLQLSGRCSKDTLQAHKGIWCDSRAAPAFVSVLKDTSMCALFDGKLSVDTGARLRQCTALYLMAIKYVQPLTHCITPKELECALRWSNKPSEAFLAAKADTSCSLNRYSCLAEASQCAPTDAAPSMPGIQRQPIAQAGRHPPGAPTRKLPSNMAAAQSTHRRPNHLNKRMAAQTSEC